jgi:hypothetical protein
MARRLAAIICLISFWSPASHGELLPADRKTDWTPGVMVGVPGGIPNRTKLVDVTASPYNADKTGAGNASVAIQDAIDNANANDVIFLPAGTYRLESGLNLKDNTTIRGQGMDVTTLKFNGSTSGAFNARKDSQGFWDASTFPVVTSGATKGSTVLTVSDTSNFTVGRMLQVARFNSESQFENPLFVYVSGNSGGGGYTYKQKSKLVAKTGNTLTIFPPLYGNMNGQTVRVVPGQHSGGGIGIEDLTIDLSNASIPFGIFLEEQIGSWIKNVRIKGASNYSVHLMDCLQCEVRDSYLDELNHSGTNGAGLLFNATCATLVENNIIRNSFPLIEVNSGSSGNVFGYNFCLNDDPLFAIDTNHGPHNSFNLYEGNVANNLIADGFFGSASQDTVFRNWLHGINTGWCLSLKRFTRDYSVIGNILGAPTWDMTYDGTAFGQPNIGNGSSSGTAPPWADWGRAPGPGGFQELDLGVQATLIRKGNYNFFNKAIPAAESLGGDSLPNSLYLTGKPSWFGNLAWPPMNPASPGTPSSASEIYAKIPAGYRFVNGSNPPGASSPSGPIPAPTPAATPTPGPTATPEPSPTATATPTPAQNPTSGGLVLAFGFNESSGASAIDASGNQNTGTITGATRTSGKFGNALKFDGVSNLVKVNASSSLNVPSAMTLEAWVNPTAAQTAWRTIIQRELVAYWLHASSRSEPLRPATGGTFDGRESWFSGPNGIPANSWTHLASTYDGSTLRLYVNGKLVGNGVVIGSIQASSSPLWIGGMLPFGEFFEGLIDEVRVYNRALSEPEIQADMNISIEGATTASPAPPPTSPTQGPTASGLVAAFGFEESSGASAFDASGNQNTGNITGATRTSGKFGNALEFDGSNNSVKVNASASLNLSSAMTLEAWVYTNADQNGWRTIIQREKVAYWLHASSRSEPLRPATGGTFGGREVWFSAPNGIPVNSWTHLASTYDGSTLRLYVNGNLVGNGVVTGSIQTNSSPLWIGGVAPFGECFQGRIDEVRIYNRALSQSEIKADMQTSVVP